MVALCVVGGAVAASSCGGLSADHAASRGASAGPASSGAASAVGGAGIGGQQSIQDDAGSGSDEPGCDLVSCLPTAGCASSTHVDREPGACCPACVPNGTPDCGGTSCADPSSCPLGYTPGDGTNGCCSECVPDPYYCGVDSDCLLAGNTNACCGYLTAISMRLYNDNPCYRAPGLMRSVPASCAGPVCSCGPAPPDPTATCVNHRCVTMLPPPTGQPEK